jgi:hypothetical protein
MSHCATVHMMGGAHAKKFGSNVIDRTSLFGQVFTRLEPTLLKPRDCAAAW